LQVSGRSSLIRYQHAFSPSHRSHRKRSAAHQLALPIQHFIDKHPDKSREQLITEMCEVVAELVGSSTPSWADARKLAKFATDQLNDQVYLKFLAFERLRGR
jgi:hypothetical protein